jgi:hypothetical protein
VSYAKLLDKTPAEYHGDAGPGVPWFSYSVAKTLLTESPMHAFYYHPRLGGHAREQTKPMGAGQVIHKLLLGIGADIVVIRADNFRTKAAQEMRDAATAAGKTPIIAHEYDGIVEAADILRGKLSEFGVDLASPQALREQVIEWDEETPLGPVRCRGMLDYLDLAAGIVLDPKSTNCAHPRKVQRTMHDFAYPIQEAAYCSALSKLDADLEGRVDFGFLFMELEPPHGVLPVHSTEGMKDLGRMQWNRAVRLWQQCLTSGKWPGYSDGWHYMAPSNWAMEQELEMEIHG